MGSSHAAQPHEAWNKGKLVGQKAPFKLKEIWAIRIRLQMQERMRELALFDLDIDSKLRACDLVLLRVRDVCHGDRVAARAIVLQQKSQRPVQFEITAQTREALETWIKRARLKSESFLFPSRVSKSPHLGARQYANRRSLGRGNRSRSEFVRNTFDAQDESIVALPTHEEPQGGSAASRAHQARKHSTISRHRGRRRTGDRGTDRGVSAGSLSVRRTINPERTYPCSATCVSSY